MTAMVAHHSNALWPQDQRRPDAVMNLSPVGMPSMVSASQSQTPRPYQTSQMEMNMPVFATTSMGPAMNFQPTTYGFDLGPMNQYAVQQPINFGYQPHLQHAATFPQTASQTSPSLTITDVRSNMSHVHRSPTVKSEPSPVDGITVQTYPMAQEECSPAPSTEST